MTSFSQVVIRCIANCTFAQRFVITPVAVKGKYTLDLLFPSVFSDNFSGSGQSEDVSFPKEEDCISAGTVKNSHGSSIFVVYVYGRDLYIALNQADWE